MSNLKILLGVAVAGSVGIPGAYVIGKKVMKEKSDNSQDSKASKPNNGSETSTEEGDQARDGSVTTTSQETGSAPGRK